MNALLWSGRIKPPYIDTVFYANYDYDNRASTGWLKFASGFLSTIFCAYCVYTRIFISLYTFGTCIWQYRISLHSG